MHKDVIKVPAGQVVKPTGEIYIVYFSSISNNTHRFIQKIEGVKNTRIPVELEEKITVDSDYVLITPTYGGGGEETKGAVPQQVMQFLNDPKNRSFCRGVIASGNTNFGNGFAIAGPILSSKLNVPLLFQFELLGTKQDVDNIKKILVDFWEEQTNE